MKSLKIIIPTAVAIVLIVAGYFIWSATDHRAELAQLIYYGDAQGLEDLLKNIRRWRTRKTSTVKARAGRRCTWRPSRATRKF